MYVAPLARLIEEFEKLPGIGKKTASRIAFYVLGLNENNANRLANSIIEAKQKITYCEICQNLTDIQPCKLCTGPKRNKKQICVVESPKDIVIIEKTKEYTGLYHVLHGFISPMDGIGPDDIRISELLKRLREQPADQPIEEIIMATNPSVEGEATAVYLAKIVSPYCRRVTRIARGVPVGGDLEFTDELTLTRAFAGRNQI